MTGSEAQTIFSDASNYIPTRKDVAAGFAKNAVQETVVAQAGLTKAGVKSPVARTIIPDIQAHIQAMMVDGTSVDETLSSLEQKIEEQLTKQGYK